MNPIVLVVAGIFVLAGLVLIVLSFLVARTPREEEAVIEASGSFIDQPLETDFTQDMGAPTETAPAEEPASTPEPVSSATGEPEIPDEFEIPDEPTEELPVVTTATAAPTETAPSAAPALPSTRALAAVAAAGLASGASHRQAAYEFRVQLGFRFLEAGLYREAAEEFQTAASLSGSEDVKLKLYIEIGNAFRRQHMYPQAMAAYLQATAYTTNPQLTQHLERTMGEIAEADASDGPSDVKEE